MRRCYYLPTDIIVSGDVSAADRDRLTAAVSAAIALAVKGAASPGEALLPVVGGRPQPRQRVGPAQQDLYFIPSYGGDDEVGLPAANAATAIQYPAPMRTTDVAFPPTDRPDAPVVGSDRPGFLTYVRTGLESGLDETTLGLLFHQDRSVDYWQVVIREPVFLVDRTVPFWGIDAVRRYAEVLAQGWHLRQKTVDVAQKVRELAKDFDETMQGSFARSNAFNYKGHDSVPLDGLPGRLIELLAIERARLEKIATGRHLTGTAWNNVVLEGLLTYRVTLQSKIEKHVVQAAWGWMRERRENLDFVTLPVPGVASIYPYGPSTPAGIVEAEVVRAALGPKRQLTQQEHDKALEQATRALRKREKDPTLELNPDQIDEAIAAAEARKLGGQALASALNQAAVAAEADDLVDVQEEDESKALVWGPAWGHRGKNDPMMRVLRPTAEFVQLLATVYGKPFGASNYHNHGGGSFKNRGRSVDLTLPHQEASGFYPAEEVIRFAIAIDIAAGQLNMGWRALYNDASVARAVNKFLGKARMGEMANNFTGPKGEILNINWHGPLVTHLHIDLAY
jgi:hypothetical protein